MKLEEIQKEYDEVLEELGDPELISDAERFKELSKRKAYLEKIIAKQKELDEIKFKIEENHNIVSSEDDQELVALAEGELKTLSERQKQIEKEIEELLKSKEEATPERSSPKAVIVEIRAGTGGEEAALFAADLFRMYSKYAASRDWKQKILDSSPTELGGYKEIIFEVSGANAWQSLKQEAGVHRVQRIPVTEKGGRIHTSTASVAVLEKPERGRIKINPNDLKIETYKSSGPGGQYVNKRMTAVRIRHLPTGLVVTSQTERNLQQNKENALSILEAKLLEIQQEQEEEKIIGTRRAQIKRAKRAEKIRTYNFPQDRVTDHRIKKSFHNIKAIMDGRLDPIIESLATFV